MHIFKFEDSQHQAYFDREKDAIGWYNVPTEEAFLSMRESDIKGRKREDFYIEKRTTKKFGRTKHGYIFMPGSRVVYCNKKGHIVYTYRKASGGIGVENATVGFYTHYSSDDTLELDVWIISKKMEKKYAWMDIDIKRPDVQAFFDEKDAIHYDEGVLV